MREEALQSGLLSRLSNAIVDRRHDSYTRHKIVDLVTQRVLQICQGDADCIDCDVLKSDPMLKLGVNRDPKGNDLGSQSTMSRLAGSP